MHYLLVITICMPGAWDYCSNGIRDIRIDNIPTAQECERQAKLAREQDYHIRNTMCIPQKEISN